MRLTSEQTQFLRELYEAHHDTMYYIAKRIVKDATTASDVVSQTFLRLILRIDAAMEYSDPVKWLYHVLKNNAIDEYRRMRRHAAMPLEDVPNVPSTVAEPEMTAFEDLLPAELTQEERCILILRIKESLDYTSIAQYLGATEGACRMKFSRARKHCAELMSQEQQE